MTAVFIRQKQKRSKYGARKCTIDGFLFDSISEGKRYGELKLLQRAGKISELKVHPYIDIVINGIKVCKVVADFSYRETVNTHWVIWEDVKGMDTAISKLKRKLVKAYNITIDWRIVKTK